ncbi:MAG: hypothetical protein H6668_10335 [Ardenticatenaceae bacterium]|nr:hypothetical protein [Ardenticatenaceae bacterium]
MKNQRDIYPHRKAGRRPGLDATIHPQHLNFTGQGSAQGKLKDLQLRRHWRGKEPLDHVLFHAKFAGARQNHPLSHIVANEMNVNIRDYGRVEAIERAGDLARHFDQPAGGRHLVCDEVHRLGRAVEEFSIRRWRILCWILWARVGVKCAAQAAQVLP